MKKPTGKLATALGILGAAFGLYVIGAVILTIDGTTIQLYDKAPGPVQAAIKVIYEPFFKVFDWATGM
jgi:hypothetical protein